jgi:hypothetical protein
MGLATKNRFSLCGVTLPCHERLVSIAFGSILAQCPILSHLDNFSIAKSLKKISYVYFLDLLRMGYLFLRS